MKQIDLYIIRKFLVTFFYAIGLIILVVIVFDISEKLDDFIDHQYFSFVDWHRIGYRLCDPGIDAATGADRDGRRR